MITLSREHRDVNLLRQEETAYTTVLITKALAQQVYDELNLGAREEGSASFQLTFNYNDLEIFDLLLTEEDYEEDEADEED